MDGDVASLTRCTTGGLYRMSKDNEVLKASSTHGVSSPLNSGGHADGPSRLKVE